MMRGLEHMGLFFKNETLEGSIKDYGVMYLGGHPDYPQIKHNTITFNIMPDCFFIRPANERQKWLKEFKIPYISVSKLEIVQRTVSAVEGQGHGKVRNYVEAA
jgi:hypothetical protein